MAKDISNAKKDALRYLGHTNQVIDQDMNEKIDGYLKELSALPGQYHYQIFDLEGDQILGTTIQLSGSSISNILSQSKKVALFACTLGIAVDRKIHSLKYTSGSDMMIYDACASAQIEEFLDEMVDEIKKTYQTTPRFSPGYGDFNLSYQRNIVKVLNSEKKLNIKVNTSSQLLPMKSVTGIIGLSDEKMTVNYQNCDDCLKRLTCDYQICKREV